jgi:hypothetical protein
MFATNSLLVQKVGDKEKKSLIALKPASTAGDSLTHRTWWRCGNTKGLHRHVRGWCPRSRTPRIPRDKRDTPYRRDFLGRPRWELPLSPRLSSSRPLRWSLQKINLSGQSRSRASAFLFHMEINWPYYYYDWKWRLKSRQIDVPSCDITYDSHSDATL